MMPERDPYDFSALAPDIDFGDDSVPVLGPHHDLAAAEELQWGDEFDADFDAMAAETAGSWPNPPDDAGYRQLQAALQRLGEGLVDLQLEAEEAWLEALLLEEDASRSPSSSPAAALAFDDIPDLEDDW